MMTICVTICLSCSKAEKSSTPVHKIQSSEKTIPTPQPSEVTPALPPLDINPENIKTFAQSLEDVQFSFNPESQDGVLDFDFWDIDHLTANARAPYTSVQALSGKLDHKGYILLLNEKHPEILAQAKCANRDCSLADLEITKTTEKTAESAFIKYTLIENAKSLVDSGSGKATDAFEATQTFVSNSLWKNPVTTRFHLIEIREGLKNIYYLKFTFSNQTVPKNDPEYFDLKFSTLTGELSGHSLSTLAYTEVKEGKVLLKSTPYQTNAYWNAKEQVLCIVFEKDEGLKSIRVGKSLF